MTGRLFAALLVVTLAFRFWLAAALPMTGDEAYFIWWGWKPDWGYYDHPPMVGWWLVALLQVHDAEWWLRLPSILQPALLALAIFLSLPRLVPGIENERRCGIALLTLLAPVNVWNILVTTDTPLIYFSVLSGLAWLRASRDDDPRWYFVAGILLAGAVLSKYFAAILGFAYLIDVVRRRTPRAFAGLLLAYACTLPALALMVWWNSENCWPNYMFNFVNRHGDAGWSIKTFLLYGATLLYALSPPVAWLALKNRSDRRLASADFLKLPGLGILAWVPLALLAVLAFVKQIGLHWLLSFVPFALIWLGLRLAPATLRSLGGFFVGFAALHVATIVVVSRLPLESWNKTRLYDGIVLSFEHKALARELAPYRGGADDQVGRWVLAMDGYSNAATLGYNLRDYVMVFGEASSHARQDDIETDFRALAGRNILILRKSEPNLDSYSPYFRSVSLDSFEVRGVRFWRVKGENFNYPVYRDVILAGVKKKYYAIPAWLSQNACYFCDRYFPEEACRR